MEQGQDVKPQRGRGGGRERGRETRWQKKETERKMGERVRHADRRGEEGERVSEEAKEAGEVKALLIS